MSWSCHSTHIVPPQTSSIPSWPKMSQILCVVCVGEEEGEGGGGGGGGEEEGEEEEEEGEEEEEETVK